MLAAFRAAVPTRSRRRSLGRLGVGGVTLGVAVALSGGVAAAYTASLPAPVQQFAHDITTWLGPVKVPAAHHKKSIHHQVANPQPVVSAPLAPAPATTPTGSATRLGHPKPATSHRAASHPAAHSQPDAKPTTSPKPAVTPTPSTTPTPTPTPTPTQTESPRAGLDHDLAE